MSMQLGIDEIVALARQQTALEAQIEVAEENLKRLKTRLRSVQEDHLPMAMLEARVKKFTLDTGESVECKPDFTVGIPAPRRAEAFSWLEQGGYGGLIKTQVMAEFGKGELERAVALAKELAKQKYTCVLERDIHWQTLKAFVSESWRMNRNIPLDLFGASPQNKAIIKAPKPKKEK